MMRYGSLFSGIGGLDLGLDRAGWTCAWQVEADAFCRQVLERHWPNLPRFKDVREVGPELAPVELIAGGFPCQDISSAAGRRRVGISGPRSGLWSEFARVVRLLRPRFVLVENVAALLGFGAGRVLGDLSELGYDAEWSVVSGCSLGAPHMRPRLFIVADAHGERRKERMGQRPEAPVFPSEVQPAAAALPLGRAVWDPSDLGALGVVDGTPDRVDAHRVKACGNAVLPQVAEWIGRRLLEVA